MDGHQAEAQSDHDNHVARLLEHDLIEYAGIGTKKGIRRHYLGPQHLKYEEILENDWMDVLVEVMQKSTNLCHLKLTNSFSNISDLNGEFFDALASNQTIEILELDRYEITDREANFFAEALRANTTIEELYLYFHVISDSAFQYLTDSFKENRGIHTLELRGWGEISNSTFQYLTDSLKENRGIRTLHLGGKFRMADLADSLKENTTIVAIHLCHFGKIDNECVKSLADAIRVNRSLKNIYFDQISLNLEEVGVEEMIDLISAVITNSSVSLTLSNGWDIKCISYNDGYWLASWLEEVRKLHENEINKKNKEIERIASLQSEIDIKNEQMIALKSAIRGSMEQEPIDLTCDGESEPPTKRPCNETPATKSNLSILLEQNQKMIKVKMEKNDAEAILKAVREEKEVTKAELEDTREDLDIANETVQQQALATDIWQRKFDELAALVAGKVDGAAVAAIRNRSLAYQH